MTRSQAMLTLLTRKRAKSSAPRVAVAAAAPRADRGILKQKRLSRLRMQEATHPSMRNQINLPKPFRIHWSLLRLQTIPRPMKHLQFPLLSKLLPPPTNRRRRSLSIRQRHPARQIPVRTAVQTTPRTAHRANAAAGGGASARTGPEPTGGAQTRPGPLSPTCQRNHSARRAAAMAISAVGPANEKRMVDCPRAGSKSSPGVAATPVSASMR